MRILYLSHNGLSEPLGRSQIVPYLIGVARAGCQVEAVAFEPRGANPQRVTEELADHGIRYYWSERSPSHHLATKLAESARGLLRALQRSVSRRPRLIHARAHFAAAVGMTLRRALPGARLLFDCRGLMGDEYLEYGHWSRESREYRLLKAVERQLFGRTDGLVVLTDRLARWLREEARLVDARRPLEIIPCCVDLARFRFDPSARVAARAELGAGDHELLLVYSGSLGACYCDEEIAQLFAAVRRRRPARLAILTRSPADRIRAALRRHGVAEDDVIVRAVPSERMPSLLSAADAAVGFITPFFSKMASSPTKTAEYLAVGLPVAVNEGVGDQDALLRRHPELLVSAGRLGAAEIDAVAARLAALPPLDGERRAAARAVAERHFALDDGVQRYLRIYERLAS